MARPISRPANREDDVPDRLEKYRSYLKIDRVDLDECLIKQPELFYHVAEAFTQATAERDRLKLDLEEAQAEQDKKIREDAANMEEKITETAIQQRLKLSPKLQTLQREMLDLQVQVGSWAALKESYHQRSYMLKELVALYLGQLRDNSIESSSNRTRGDLGDINREKTGRMREQRRVGGSADE